MTTINPDLFSYLKQHGSHCMAYTSLEPEMEYFEIQGLGYIAFIRFKHWLWAWKERKIVLADPVCDVENYQQIITAFIEKHPNVIFVEASKALAEALDKMGYQVNQFGVETEILLPDFDLKGKLRAKLRQWRNKCEREGVIVKEQLIEDCSNQEEINALSKAWLATKGGRAFGFLVRPLREKNEPDVRYFWAYKDEQLIALAVFDPIYKDGEIIAYYHNMDRMIDTAPHGTSAFIILSAIDVFKEEGIEFVSLGMSPLYLQRGMTNEFNYHQFTRKSFWYAFEKLNFFYPFKGNASHKNKFNGIKKPIYISSTNGTGLKEAFVMMKALGVF